MMPKQCYQWVSVACPRCVLYKCYREENRSGFPSQAEQRDGVSDTRKWRLRCYPENLFCRYVKEATAGRSVGQNESELNGKDKKWQLG